MEHSTTPRGDPLEVLLCFARLGVTAFGGPIAHLGYFRQEFVVRRQWLTEEAYADLIALCQFLPGPASSQVGFSLGLMRAGYLGGVAAWAGFTLPSAALMFAFAAVAASLAGPVFQATLHGLKVVAVAVVAQAVWSMARGLCPDLPRALIAVAVATAALLFPSPATQLLAILAGGSLGLLLAGTAPQAATHFAIPVSRRAGVVCLGLFLVLLLGLPLTWRFFDAFYRAGALVFGGGHVVLPLLNEALVAPGWVDGDRFLAGYGFAQAVPGPLFTFAVYLGAIARPAPGALAGAIIGLAGIFLPGLLIVVGVLPFWSSLRRTSIARRLMSGANAAVVGILAAAFCTPVWTSGIADLRDGAFALVGFLLLWPMRAPPLLVVALITLGTAISRLAFA